MGPAQAIRIGFAKSFQFSGRASRSEFWWFSLAFCCAIFAAAFTLTHLKWLFIGRLETILIWKSLNTICFASLVSLLSVSARRHHDIGFPAFLPSVALLPLLALLCASLVFLPALLGADPDPLLFMLKVVRPAAELLLVLLIASAVLALFPSKAGTNGFGAPPTDLKPQEVQP